MRNTLEPWETGLLCELWNRTELAVLDDKPKTPQYVMRLFDRTLRKMQLEYRRGSVAFPSQMQTNPLYEMCITHSDSLFMILVHKVPRSLAGI